MMNSHHRAAMTNAFNREELLNHLISLMHDPAHRETLQRMTDAQLKIAAQTFDDLSRWKPDRRGVTRRAVTRRVHVALAGGGGYGLQEDVSDTGIGIFLQRPVPLMTRIRIRADGQDSIGIVHRCKQEKGGWTIGVVLEKSGGPA